MSTLRVRPAAVAGAFYPAYADELASQVDAYVAEGSQSRWRQNGRSIRAVIVPHAGYVYSGPVAGVAYAQLAAMRRDVRHVMLLGPAHYVPVHGLAVPSAGAFATPLGEIAVDEEMRERLLDQPGVAVDDVAHEPEHSLEVQLPFLQRTLPGTEVLPVIVGRAAPGEVADVLEPWADDPRTILVVSSDLSHYLDYRTARYRDAATAAAIVARRADAIQDDDACGSRPVRGLLELARRRGWTVDLLDLRNSGDTAGPRSQVVGYGAFVVTEEETE
jgi:AmmeMemoRadiSam system protein B